MKKILVTIILIVLIFYFFKNTLNYYFISDDFYYLSFKKITDAFRPYSDRYHYIPIFLIVLTITKKIFGLNPLPFHLIAVTLHLINVGLVYCLARKILKDNVKAVFSALIFAFFFSHYEVVYWITGIATSLMTIFYLLGLIVFINYLKKPRLSTYFLFIICFILALFTHEYAITLPLVCFLYAVFLNKRKIKQWFKLFITPLFILTLWFGMKTVFFEGYQLANKPGLKQVFASIIKSFLYLFLPNPSLIDNLPKFVLIIIFLSLIGVLITFSLKNKQRQFLLLWLMANIGTFSLTSLPQARYFYLLAVPTIIMTVSLLSKKKISNYLIYIYLFFVFFSGLFFLQEQKKYWSETSKITQKVLEKVNIFIPKVNDNKNLYFVNLPDHLGNPIWPAYLFRVGFQEALELKYGLEVRRINLVQIDKTSGYNPMISIKNLNDLKTNKEPIFIYRNYIDNVASY